MIDSFSILLSHGLLLVAFWRLLARPDLDDEAATPAIHADAADPAAQARERTIFPDA